MDLELSAGIPGDSRITEGSLERWESNCALGSSELARKCSCYLKSVDVKSSGPLNIRDIGQVNCAL